MLNPDDSVGTQQLSVLAVHEILNKRDPVRLMTVPGVNAYTVRPNAKPHPGVRGI